MKLQEILSAVDHTKLSVSATRAEILALCDDAIKYGTASVCVPPSYVRTVREYVGDKMKVCTVIGFPNGYNTTACKVFETKDAVENGADEIDMVINVGWLKDKDYVSLLNEMKAVRAACEGKILKVIVETCLLTDDEKVRILGIVSASGADFIKTSTGFSTGGATREDIALFEKHRAPTLKIKAAGGISSLTDAEDMMKLGASRLGTSRIVTIVKNEETKGETY
jgi:deoxyribose-phosphate aldolase